MAVNITRQGDTDQYDIIRYCCDKREDISILPVIGGAGSECFVIEDSSIWILGSDKKWYEL